MILTRHGRTVALVLNQNLMGREVSTTPARFYLPCRFECLSNRKLQVRIDAGLFQPKILASQYLHWQIEDSSGLLTLAR